MDTTSTLGPAEVESESALEAKDGGSAAMDNRVDWGSTKPPRSMDELGFGFADAIEAKAGRAETPQATPTAAENFMRYLDWFD
jgi:hypothetical protein